VTGNLCPVCGFPDLPEAAYQVDLPSFEICVCCGTQFGYDDSTLSFGELRKKWIEGGCNWWGNLEQRPELWNPERQLRSVSGR
jgi:hypothetical protein